MAEINWPPVKHDISWLKWHTVNVPNIENRMAGVWSTGVLWLMVCYMALDQKRISMTHPLVLGCIAYLIFGTVWSLTASVKIDNIPPGALVWLIVDDWEGFYLVKGPFPRRLYFYPDTSFCSGVAIMEAREFSVCFINEDGYYEHRYNADVVFEGVPSPHVMRAFWSWCNRPSEKGLNLEGLRITVYQESSRQYRSIPGSSRHWEIGGYED